MAIGDGLDEMSRYYMQRAPAPPLPAGQALTVRSVEDGPTVARMLVRGPAQIACPKHLRQAVRTAVGEAKAAGRLTRQQAAGLTFLDAPANGQAPGQPGPAVHDPGPIVEMNLGGKPLVDAPPSTPQAPPTGTPALTDQIAARLAAAGQRQAFNPAPAIAGQSGQPGQVTFEAGS